MTALAAKPNRPLRLVIADDEAPARSRMRDRRAERRGACAQLSEGPKRRKPAAPCDAIVPAREV